ncbi:MAG: arylsulfatase [Bacteroidales bacterium]
MNKFYFILPLGAAFVSCANNNPVSRSIEGRRPNVLLILSDDVGYGDLGCYGTSSVNTPNVDKLASEGLMFTNAHSTSATSTPSRYSMLTGEYAWRRDGTGIAAGNAAMIIKPERYTIADMFKSAGYATAVVGKWHLGLGDKTGEQDWNGTVSPNPSDLGFDYSYIMAATADRTPCMFMENGKGVGLDPSDPVYVSYTENFKGEPTGKDNPELLRMVPSHGHDQSIVNGISRIGYMKGGQKARWRDEDIADSIVAHGCRFIEKQKEIDQPFFLYLATNDIHVPRVPNERFVGKSGLGARGDAILSLDWSVGQIMSTLNRLGLDENTMVILSSDNGAVIDDGYQDRAVELLGDHRAMGIFRGGKYSIFEGGTRIPCIVRWKGIVQPSVSEVNLSQIDWFASLAAMVGIDIPEGAAPDSRNYLEAMLNPKAKCREYIVEQNLQNNLGISDGVWKYIPAAEGPAMNLQTDTELGNDPGEDQLYDMVTDPQEKHNVASSHPDIVSRLSAELMSIIAKSN